MLLVAGVSELLVEDLLVAEVAELLGEDLLVEGLKFLGERDVELWVEDRVEDMVHLGRLVLVVLIRGGVFRAGYKATSLRTARTGQYAFRGAGKSQQYKKKRGGVRVRARR